MGLKNRTKYTIISLGEFVQQRIIVYYTSYMYGKMQRAILKLLFQSIDIKHSTYSAYNGWVLAAIYTSKGSFVDIGQLMFFIADEASEVAIVSGKTMYIIIRSRLSNNG